MEEPMNIYVGNLSFETTNEDLRMAFRPFGQVSSATVIRDKLSGRSRGFGFVEMPNPGEAWAAIRNLHGKDLLARHLIVNEARGRTEGRRSAGQGQGRHRIRNARERYESNFLVESGRRLYRGGR
jgi:RNA recognition motif-containing protein